MHQMAHHTRAAARGVRRSMVVADLPFGSYLTPADAAANGVRLLKEGKADAVKLEGGKRACAQARLVDRTRPHWRRPLTSSKRTSEFCLCAAGAAHTTSYS